MVGILVVLLLNGLWHLNRARRFQIAGDLVARVETSQPIVALTFDDGPTAAHTRAVLKILEIYGVCATFFVTGKETESHPAIARDMIAAGHELGNHSYTHPRLIGKSYRFIAEQIEKTDEAIVAAGQLGTPLFRPPYCNKLFMLPLYLARNGRTTVTWDVEPETYADVAVSAEAIADHVIDQTEPGSIVLLHAHYDANEKSRRALPAIINGLHAKGLRFVTVSELLEHRFAARAS